MAGMAAAGAAAGTAIMPGIGTAIGGIAGALIDSSSSNSGSGSAPASSPNSPAISGFFADSRMSNSGWVVSTGGSKASGYSSPTDSGMTPSLTAASGYGLVGDAPGQGVAGTSLTWTTIALIFAGLFLLTQKK